MKQANGDGGEDTKEELHTGRDGDNAWNKDAFGTSALKPGGAPLRKKHVEEYKGLGYGK